MVPIQLSSQPESSKSLTFDAKVGGFFSHRQYRIKELDCDFLLSQSCAKGADHTFRVEGDATRS